MVRVILSSWSDSLILIGKILGPVILMGTVVLKISLMLVAMSMRIGSMIVVLTLVSIVVSLILETLVLVMMETLVMVRIDISLVLVTLVCSILILVLVTVVLDIIVLIETGWSKEIVRTIA